MAIDRFATPLQTPSKGIPDVVLEDMDKSFSFEGSKTEGFEGSLEETEDGGLVVDFSTEEERRKGEASEAGFLDNLATFMEDGELMAVSNELMEDYESDFLSRADWHKAYSDGLDLLGLKTENRSVPWPGAAGVYHPVLTEAAVRFQAQAMSELFPASGPAKPSVEGPATPELMKRAKRVADEVNYYLTKVMVEYRSETEMMLFRLPLAGCAFKKVYKDQIKNRPVSIFVPAEDIVVPYGVSDIRSTERLTHIQKKTKNEVKKLQMMGFYRDVDLPEPTPSYSKIEDKTNKLTNEKPSYSNDDRYELLEMQVDFDLPGFEHVDEQGEPTGMALPYIITIDKGSSKVLSIYRNYKEDDPLMSRRQHFIAYHYLPGLGFYGIGLIGLIGGLAKASTSILRQLIDAGTLGNLPIGFKAKGLRVKTNDNPLRPGEFRDIDVPAAAVRDGLYQIQVKEPSSVLSALLGNIVDEARKVGSVADLKVGDAGQSMPVGSVLAIMEHDTKVMSGVQARNHASQEQELKLLYELIGAEEVQYVYDEKQEFDRAKDFMPPITVTPVSDPNASTMAQRVVQYQAAMEMATRQPEIYNLPKLHQQMLLALGVKEASEIVQIADDMQPVDPVSENMAIMTSKPVKAFLYQDHEAHIQTHMAMAQDPQIMALVGQSPNAAAMQSSMAAHVAEHVAFAYRSKIEEMMGVQLPPPGEPLPEDVELQLSRAASQAGTKALEASKAKMAQQKAQEIAEDPIYQLEKKKVDIQEREVHRKEVKDQADIAIQAKQAGMDEKAGLVNLLTDAAQKSQELNAEGQRKAMEMRQQEHKANLEAERDARAARMDQLRAGNEAARLARQGQAEKERLDRQAKADQDKIARERQMGRVKVETAKAISRAKVKAANKPKPKKETP